MTRLPLARSPTRIGAGNEGVVRPEPLGHFLLGQALGRAGVHLTEVTGRLAEGNVEGGGDELGSPRSAGTESSPRRRRLQHSLSERVERRRDRLGAPDLIQAGTIVLVEPASGVAAAVANKNQPGTAIGPLHVASR